MFADRPTTLRQHTALAGSVFCLWLTKTRISDENPLDNSAASWEEKKKKKGGSAKGLRELPRSVDLVLFDIHSPPVARPIVPQELLLWFGLPRRSGTSIVGLLLLFYWTVFSPDLSPAEVKGMTLHWDGTEHCLLPAVKVEPEHEKATGSVV